VEPYFPPSPSPPPPLTHFGAMHLTSDILQGWPARQASGAAL
jgi:hypothetical protein